MQLRGGRMLFDMKYLANFFMRSLFKDIQVEYGAASIGKFRYECHQYFLGKTIACFGNACFVHHVGKLFLIHHQLAEALLLPQVIYRLRHHYSGHPCAQCTFSTKGEVSEDFDETIVQYVMSRVDIARIAVTYRQHLLGIEGVQFLSGRILSCTAALYQFYVIFQCQCFFADASLRRLLLRRSILRNAAELILKRS